MIITIRPLVLVTILVLGTRLVSAQIYIETSLAHDQEMNVGSSYEGTIPISNTSEMAIEVRLYLTDYRFTADGQNWYDEQGTHERSNALWIGFGSPVVTVPAQSTMEVAYRVDVPDDESLLGSYWSMLMVEAISSTSVESTLSDNPASPQFGVRRRLRYGVQIATHVLNTGEADLSLDDPKLEESAGSGVRLSVAVENSGSRLAESHVFVDLFNADGENVGRFDGSRARIYPGTSFRHSVPIGDQPEGQYEALLVIETGDETSYGAQYTLHF